jgi:hypothetical protein
MKWQMVFESRKIKKMSGPTSNYDAFAPCQWADPEVCQSFESPGLCACI